MAHAYSVDTGAWIQDETDGWISSKVLSKEINGEKVTLVFEITAGEREGEVRLKPLHGRRDAARMLT
jgi:hypothetical protein